LPRNRSGSDQSPKTQVELLTEQFYAWERRGRGWHVWPHTVQLEPPFTPFRFHWPPPQTRRDDGRRPTALSFMTDRLLGLLSPLEHDGEGLPELDLEEVEAASDECEDELAELSLALPQSAEVSAEATEHLLLSLPRLSRPLAFEVIGRPDAISVQFAVPVRERTAVEQFLRAHFPLISVSDGAGLLERVWEGGGERSGLVVEFGLAEEFMLPLRMFRRFAVDPLTGVAASLSSLVDGECGVLQVLLRPVRHTWSESIQRAVLDDSGSPFFLDAPEVTAMAREKISRPLFACLVRVAGRARLRQRAEEIVEGIGASLSAFANPPANRLALLSNDGYDDELHEADLLERRTHRSGMILSSTEVVSLVHPPSASVRVEKLVRELRSTNAAPEIATSATYKLGVNEHGGRSVEVGLTADQRSRHVYVVGASGTGKSTLLLSLILQDLEAGEGLALLDPHGDLVDEVLRRCPEKRIQDVILLDPGDAEYPIGFNVLSAHSELERTLLASDLVAVFRRLSTSWGDQMTSVLGNAILAILESDQGGTLVDLRRFLVEPGFRKEFLGTVQDPEVVYYWEREFPMLSGKPQAPLLTRLDTFLRPKPIRYMVAQKESRLDLRKLMDDGKVLLARLSQGAIGEENSSLLGTLLVSKFHQLAMTRQEQAAAERRPFYLYIDEFQNFVTPSMEGILSGARKYKLGLVLAHQEFRQIASRSPEVLHSVLSNPYARVCFRVGEEDARRVAEGFSHFDAGDILNLSTGEAIARVERSEYDFNLRTSRLPELDAIQAENRREEVVRESRTKYSRPRTEVEAVLAHHVPEPTSPGRLDRRPTHSITAERVELPTPSTDRRAIRPAQPEPVLPEDASSPVPTPTAEPHLPGRGGQQHRYLQELIRQWAEANGWRADLEEPVLGDAGRVDVALRKGSRSVACEIAVTTAADHEWANLKKCLSSGFSRVLMICYDRRLLEGLRHRAQKELSQERFSGIDFCSPNEALAALDSVQSHEPDREQTIKGYRVRVRVHSDPKDASTSARRAISTVIARALRRLK